MWIVNLNDLSLIHHQGIIFPPRRDFTWLKPRCLRSLLLATY
jgi:hypothetical protein